MRRMTAGLVGGALLAVAAQSGCLGASSSNLSDEGEADQARPLNPESCGNYAASPAGAKLKSFLEATVTLYGAAREMEGEVKTFCASMAEALGVSADGDARSMCNGVADGIRVNLRAGLKGKAGMTLVYTPAVCTVDTGVAADAAARCEGSDATAVNVTCAGQCRGTCRGECKGNCAGRAGDDTGECAGTCEGSCEGTCAGRCEGSADVQASAECEAMAEVAANVEADCTQSVVTVEYDSKVVVARPRVEAVARALKSGLPRLVVVSAKARGPTGRAFETWARTARNLAQTIGKVSSSFGDQASCVRAQVIAAARLIPEVEASVRVSVQASDSVSGAVEAGGA